MSADPRIGTQIGDYRIESMLGRGGMSVVYLAEHVRLKRKAALKLLSPELAEDPTFRQRFVSEWERLAGLDHPNIIPIFEAGEAGGLLYIAMRYVRTTDLKALITQEGRLEPERAASIIAQTASALDAAHAQSLVHRDVKPANILVAIAGGPEGSDHVYLSDFGLTKHTESRSGLTQTGHFMGTIDYVAPEQIAGKGVDGRTDQYALGCVLYECLTGKVPFPREEDTASLFAHLQDPPPKPTEVVPGLPPEIDDVIAKSMAKEKEERYGNCTEFARAARIALQLGHSPAAGVPSVPPSAAETMIAPAPMMPPTATPPTAPAASPTATPPAPVGVPAAQPGAPLPPPIAPSARPAPPPGPSPAGRGRKQLRAIVGGLVVVAAIAVFAFTQLGGGDDKGGPTSVSPSTGPSVQPGVSPVVTNIFSADDFDDPSKGWETTEQNGIDRSLTPQGTYRFAITAQAGSDAFAVSVGGVRSVNASDMSVQVVATVVTKGGGGVSNSFGVSCRANSDSAYYLLIGTSGRWAIEKLTNNTDLAFLAEGTDLAITSGLATNTIEAVCLGGRDGTPATIQLLVNGKEVGRATDVDAPIASGTAGIAVTGQQGLVVEFDGFVFEELTSPS